MITETTSGEIVQVIDIYGSNWPPKPDGLHSIAFQERVKRFGSFLPVPDPHLPGYIKITRASHFKIAALDIPQLVAHKVKGINKTGRIWVNAAMADQTKQLFEDWDAAQLMPLIKTFDGGFVPRYVRGSNTTLSNHAWGTAFDINAQWNGLGKTPAVVGVTGSVRQLVELAVKNGFYWGGWGWTSQQTSPRLDGMHFEAASLL